MLPVVVLRLALSRVKVTKSFEAATATFVTLLLSIASAFASKVLIFVVKAATLSVIEVFKSVPLYLIVAAVMMPTSRLPDVTGDMDVFVDGSLVSDILNVVADSS